MNIADYPVAEGLIKECHLENEVGRIRWIQMNREEAAEGLAKLYLTAKMAVGPSLPAREKSKKYTDQLYFSVGYKIHGFAKEEARSQMGISSQEVYNLFRHLELGGSKYKTNRIIPDNHTFD